MLTELALRSQSRAYRLRRPWVLALLCIPGAAILAIAAVSAWRALPIVRPPRVPVDTAIIREALPEAEDVTFPADDGVVLSGTYVGPRNGAAVVLVHGLFANRLQLLPEAHLLAREGFGVLLYDNRAHGNSGGSVATWGQLEGQDATRAVDYLQQRTQLPPGKIALLGFSIGGTAVLREAMDDPRVGAVVVEATNSSMAGEIASMYGRWGVISALPAQWIGRFVGGMDYAKLVPEQLVCSVGPRPLLLVYGSDDADVPLAEGQRMASAACQPVSLFVVNTRFHGSYMQAADAARYAERLLSFYRASLLGQAAGS